MWTIVSALSQIRLTLEQVFIWILPVISSSVAECIWETSINTTLIDDVRWDGGCLSYGNKALHWPICSCDALYIQEATCPLYGCRF